MARRSPKLSANDFLLQAVARAADRVSALNATFSATASRPMPASCTRAGRTSAWWWRSMTASVPVIHDVEQLSLVEIARRRQNAVDGALKGRRTREVAPPSAFQILAADGPDGSRPSSIRAIRHSRGRTPADASWRERSRCRASDVRSHNDGRSPCCGRPLASQFLAEADRDTRGRIGAWSSSGPVSAATRAPCGRRDDASSSESHTPRAVAVGHRRVASVTCTIAP